MEELFAEGEADDEVAVIFRLADPTAIPEGARIITRMGLIATGRVRRGDIGKVWAQQPVESMKAARLYGPTPAPEEPAETTDLLTLEPGPTDRRRPEADLPTGEGVVVVVAHIDWGVDFAHPDFRNADGSTRLLALWDQACPFDPRAPNRYGYGRIHLREDIDRALAAADPYAALGYNPAFSDPLGRGSHGCHTLSISAGNGRGGGPVGLAPKAHLAFVHLSTAGPDGPVLLGDSVALIEAFDFIAGIAGPRPFVVNCSLGRQCGEHDGLTLTERAMDAFLRAADGRAVCFSTGNYYDRCMHARGLLRPGEQHTLDILIEDEDPGPMELDLWYPGPDRFGVSLGAPGGVAEVQALPGVRAEVVVDGRCVGRLYHRLCDPNCGDNEVTLFLERAAPRGVWELRLAGDDIADGRFHAWIERTGGAPGKHGRFTAGDDDPSSTTGTICNGLWTIAVGAYDGHRAERPLAPFSSAGPTRNGRQKPDLVAPGVRVLAARSRPRDDAPGASRLARMSGTSMAAPHVTGTIALMFAAAPRPLAIAETRRLLLGAAIRPTAASAADMLRIGSGYLDTAAAVAAAARLGASPSPASVHAAAPQRAPALEGEAVGDAGGMGEPEATPAVEMAESAEPALVLEAEGAEAEEAEEVEVAEMPSEVEAIVEDAEAALDAAEFAISPYPPPEPAAEFAISPYPPPDPLAEVGERVLVAAEALAGRGSMASEAFLESIVESGLSAIVAEGAQQDRLRYREHIAVLARPGEPCQDIVPRTGDLLVRVAPGEGFALIAVVAQPGLFPHHRLAVHGLRAEGALPVAPGFYVHVVEAGPRPRTAEVGFARRLADAGRIVLPDTLLLRVRAAPLEWDGIIGVKTWRALDLYSEQQTPSGPVLDPARWGPVLAARLSPRAVLRAANAVRFLIDGAETFRAMVEAIRTAQEATHFIYLLGWKLVDDFEMIPGDASSTVQRLMADASARGVQIRAILWAKPPLENRAEVARINALPTGGAIRDNETPHPRIGAHHQKLLVVKGSAGLIGFCGGVDINSDRIMVVGSTTGEPLHDVHCRIAGPAARDVLETFIRRWDHHPNHVAIDAARGGLIGRSEPAPAPILSPAPATTSTGATCSVAVARTFNPVARGSTLLRERDIRALLLASIAAAQRFIYIEDQYLIDLDTAAALSAAVPRLSHLTILIAASEISDLPCVWKFRRDFVSALTRGLGPGDVGKVRIFDRITPPAARPTFGTHTYVHAKCWVFDDELAVIGSANCNRRGYQHDSEVNAFVFDDRAPAAGSASFAQAMRMALWAEHLGVPLSAVADGVASARLWLTRPSGASVRPYDSAGGRDRTPDVVCDATRDDIDPGLP